MKRWLFALVLLLAPALHAATYRAVVTHVTDGDSLWVRPASGGDTAEIRLLDMDAPEGCQLFGRESKQALRARVLHQPVRVRTGGLDDFGRQLARIDHRGEDIGGWMVRNGYAWSLTFKGKAGPYEKLERQARRESKGLWGLPGAQEPRSFRRRFGRCQ